jgi:hypothetical protein
MHFKNDCLMGVYSKTATPEQLVIVRGLPNHFQFISLL